MLGLGGAVLSTANQLDASLGDGATLTATGTTSNYYKYSTQINALNFVILLRN